MDTRRLIFGLTCLIGGVVLLFLPQDLVPWLPGSQVAGGVLGLSGIMFLIRGRAIRPTPAANAGADAAAAKPARAKRRRKK